MDNCTLWERKNYLMDIDYLLSTSISEYDIRKANISILYSEGVIDKKYYDYLYSADRMIRQVEVGYMIKDNREIEKILSNGIAKYRKMFFEANDLKDNDILSIKNDAIFVLRKKPTITKFGNIEFVNKNNYTSYMKILRKKEIYLNVDHNTGNTLIDIKGISDQNILKHKDYMIQVIVDIAYYIENKDVITAIRYITNLYNQYIARSLPLGFYRNFDEESKFVFKSGIGYYSMDTIYDERFVNILDISCNTNVIRDIYGILLNIYFSKNRGRWN